MVALDHAALFQPLDAAADLRWRQRDVLRQLLVGGARVFLQRLQNLVIETVEVDIAHFVHIPVFGAGSMQINRADGKCCGQAAA
ncbi:hypothetical protein D3C85_1300940 [compost metagenome]